MFFSRKSITKKSSNLPKTLEFKHLIMLGLAACIGGGIMTQVGKVIFQEAGAGIWISYLLAGIGCMLVALPYSELAAMIKCSGGIYTYTYIAFGRFFGWLMFAMVVGELVIAASVVSMAWFDYTLVFLNNFLPVSIPEAIRYNCVSNGFINLPSIIILLISAHIVSQGMDTNKLINLLLVYAKFIALGAFILCSITDISTDRLVLHPTYQWNGVFTAVSTVFFAFTGFTSLANAAEEAKNPSKDLSLAIIFSIIIATIVYMTTSFVLAASTDMSQLNNSSVLANSLMSRGYVMVSLIVSSMASISMLSVAFACIYATSRVVFVLAQDKVLPHYLTELNANKVPANAIWFTAYMAIFASQFLTLNQMFHITALSPIIDYMIASILVLYFRIYYPNQERPFVSPVVWLLSSLSLLYLGYFLFFSITNSAAGISFGYFLAFFALIYPLTLLKK